MHEANISVAPRLGLRHQLTAIRTEPLDQVRRRWRDGAIIAHLAAGPSPLAPQINLVADELLKGASRASVITSRAMHPVRSSQFPVARAAGIAVFCVPHLAFTSQANPTHQRHCMHGGLPL